MATKKTTNKAVETKAIETKQVAKNEEKKNVCISIEEVSAKEIEKECGEKLGACIRLHFEDNKTATFSKKSKLDYEVL